MESRTLIAHPKLPILHVLTADGRILIIAIIVKVNHQVKNSVGSEEEDNVFSDDEGMFSQVKLDCLNFLKNDVHVKKSPKKCNKIPPKKSYFYF